MKIRSILIVCISASMANAEVISFRSGDHPDFARIVADIPVGAPWQIGRAGQSYALQVESRHSFDTRPIFERIQRNRLAGVRQDTDSGRLYLDLACDCHIDAFLFRPDKLVIDIKDGPPPGPSPFENPLPGTYSEVSAELPLLMPRSGLDPLGQFSQLPELLQQEGAPESGVMPAEEALIESLARAMSQGLLDADHSMPDIPEFASAPVVETASVAPQLPLPTEMPPPSAESAGIEITSSEQGLSIQTVIDRDGPVGERQVLGPSGAACLDNRHFDIASWSASDDFAAEIGARRDSLVREDDQFSDTSVEELARTYLYFGFGREAIATLGLDGVRNSDRDIIVAIAQIIDDLPTTAMVFADQEGCARPVALWRALGRRSLEGTTEQERTAIATAHRVLPGGLRDLLSPRLALLFLDAGDPTMAEAIRAPTAMAPSPPDDALSAAIAREIEGPEVALETAARVVSEEGRASPALIVSLIDLSIDENRPIDDEVLALAETLRFENQGTPDEISLGLAEFRAFLSADRFSDAKAVLDDLDRLTPHERQAHLTDWAIAVSGRSPDRQFLEFFFSDGIDATSASAGNAVARRLIDLGFVTQAAELIQGPADGDDMAERRYLRAEVAAELDQFQDVEDILSGMSDPRSIALRGRIPGNSADTEDSAQTDTAQSWRNGEWAELRTESDPVLQSAARAMLSEPAITTVESTLAEREALIAEAEVTRTLAEELLDRFQITPEIGLPLTE